MANYEPPEDPSIKGEGWLFVASQKGYSWFTTILYSCQKFTVFAFNTQSHHFFLEHSWAKGQRKLHVVHKPWKHFFEIISIESRLLGGTGYVRAALGAFALGWMRKSRAWTWTLVAIRFRAIPSLHQAHSNQHESWWSVRPGMVARSTIDQSDCHTVCVAS